MSRGLFILLVIFLLFGCKEEEPWQSESSVHFYGSAGSLRIDWLSSSLFRFVYLDEGGTPTQVSDSLWFLDGAEDGPEFSLIREGRNYVVETADLRLEVDRHGLHTSVFSPPSGSKSKSLTELHFEAGQASAGFFQSDLGRFPDLKSLTEALSNWEQSTVSQGALPYFEEAPSLEEELAPWLKGLARSEQNGAVAAVQPLYLHYLQDEEALHWRRQYVLGGQLLVAPGSAAAGVDAEVYLPPGNWYDYYTGERLEGGRTLKIPSARLPLYVKAGGVLPLSGRSLFDHAQEQKSLYLCVFPGLTGRLLWYGESAQPAEVLTSNTMEYFQLVIPGWAEQKSGRPLVVQLMRGDLPREVLATLGRSVARLERFERWSDFQRGAAGWLLDQEAKCLWIKNPRPAQTDLRFLVSY
ncbi:TIM-barrel domain-containing protein [Geofilum rhodophaeum]|uniref:TIM-barrel domain-containing protein n=1 Tax=Geofilum rhodophaeum TaxID=1965019 RepID=UPI000B522857|nr:TIM-barrel domain-containing protein [Geofilum rhodophaeum]